LRYDGVDVEVREGETIAAALFRAGLQPRYFCGIGVCFACLVTVNGLPAQRACLVEAHPGDEVSAS
jgi:ferredoxin